MHPPRLWPGIPLPHALVRVHSHATLLVLPALTGGCVRFGGLRAGAGDGSDAEEEDGLDDDAGDGLVPFGAAPEAVAVAQAKLAERRRSAAGASSASSGAEGDMRLGATGKDGYVSRAKRRRDAPMEALPKVRALGACRRAAPPLCPPSPGCFGCMHGGAEGR